MEESFIINASKKINRVHYDIIFTGREKGIIDGLTNGESIKTIAEWFDRTPASIHHSTKKIVHKIQLYKEKKSFREKKLLQYSNYCIFGDKRILIKSVPELNLRIMDTKVIKEITDEIQKKRIENIFSEYSIVNVEDLWERILFPETQFLFISGGIGKYTMNVILRILSEYVWPFLEKEDVYKHYLPQSILNGHYRKDFLIHGIFQVKDLFCNEKNPRKNLVEIFGGKRRSAFALRMCNHYLQFFNLQL